MAVLGRLGWGTQWAAGAQRRLWTDACVCAQEGAQSAVPTSPAAWVARAGRAVAFSALFPPGLARPRPAGSLRAGAAPLPRVFPPPSPRPPSPPPTPPSPSHPRSHYRFRLAGVPGAKKRDKGAETLGLTSQGKGGDRKRRWSPDEGPASSLHVAVAKGLGGGGGRRPPRQRIATRLPNTPAGAGPPDK